MKRYFAPVLMAVALATASASYAGLGGLGDMLGGKKPADSAGADISGQQTQLVKSYINAGKDVMSANGYMAEALGLKAQAVNASAISDSMSAKDIEAQDKAISVDAEAVSNALKTGATLKDNEAKMKYGKGLLALANGVKKYIAMKNDASTFGKSLTNVNPMQLTGVQSGAYIAKNLPTRISDLTNTLKSAVDFARKNGVEVPADATSIL